MARPPKSVSIILFLPIALLSIAQSTPQSRIMQAVDNAQMVTIGGSGHPMAKAAFDRGRVHASMRLSGISMAFRPSLAQQQALQALIAEQHDRTSPNYHKWLTPETYADRFGMTQEDIAKVSAWLVSQGFTIARVARGRTQITFSGTAAQAESVFHSEIHRYEVNGEQHFANASELSLPAAFANVVLGVRGLNGFKPKTRAHTTAPSPKFTSSTSGNHFLAPNDFATIYNVKGLYDLGIDGTGQAIAVVGQSDVTLSNVATFRAVSGLPLNTPSKFLVPGTGSAIVPSKGDQIEAYLDLEWSGAIAKNAQIQYVFVGGSSPGGVFTALQYAIDNKLAPVISNSYGLCERGLSPSDASTIRGWFTEADSFGISVTSASGDSGAADCDDTAPATQGLAVDIPAAVPEVTAVGGGVFTGDASSTSTTTYWNGSNDNHGGSAIMYIPEQPWNDTAASIANSGGLDSAGGGFSTLYAKPSWQTGTGVPADGHRDVPDVTLNASNFHDPYLLCSGTNTPQGLLSCSNGFRDSSGGLDAVGGTSAGAPTFAGIIALLDQSVDPTGLGSVNPELYALAASTPSAFHDITSGDNKQPCLSGTPTSIPMAQRCPSTAPFKIGYSAGIGYDLASGLGSVDAHLLVTNWPGFSVTPTYTVGANAVTIASPGGTGTSTLTVAAVNGFNGTVDLTCTPPGSTSAKITCSITPSVTINGSSDTATLTVTTTAAHAAAAGGPSATTHSHGLGWLGAGSGIALAGIFVIGVPLRRKSTAVFGVVLLAFLATGVGCGGGGSSSTPVLAPGTPAGNYTVGVTAVSGSITRTLSVAVTVQ